MFSFEHDWGPKVIKQHSAAEIMVKKLILCTEASYRSLQNVAASLPCPSRYQSESLYQSLDYTLKYTAQINCLQTFLSTHHNLWPRPERTPKT